MEVHVVDELVLVKASTWFAFWNQEARLVPWGAIFLIFIQLLFQDEECLSQPVCVHVHVHTCCSLVHGREQREFEFGILFWATKPVFSERYYELS